MAKPFETAGFKNVIAKDPPTMKKIPILAQKMPVTSDSICSEYDKKCCRSKRI
jgi:hypothetical protein